MQEETINNNDGVNLFGFDYDSTFSTAKFQIEANGGKLSEDGKYVLIPTSGKFDDDCFSRLVCKNEALTLINEIAGIDEDYYTRFIRHIPVFLDI